MPSTVSAITAATAKFLISVGVSTGAAKATAAIATKLALTTALTTGINAITQNRPNAPTFEDPGQQLRPQRGGIIPRTIVYGETLVAGHIVFAKTSGDDRKNLDLIIALGDGGPYESIEAVYFDETELTLDGSGNVTSPSKYDGFATILTELGEESQTANSTAVSNITEWTTDHRGRGVCYAYARLVYDGDVWTSGLPTLYFKVRGRKVYDPRLDSTNGGSGTHRKDDATTWEFSQNKALWLLDWMRGVDMNGQRIAGLDVPDALIDWGAFADAADVCDEAVDVDGGGTIDRYTGGGGTVSSADDPKSVADMFIRCMAGEWAPRSGYIGVYAGASRTAAVTLTDDDLAGPIKLRTAKSVRETVNKLQATYRDPAEDYEMTDAPPYTNSSWESDDGEVFEQEITLPFIDDHRQAQRICKLIAGRIREPRRIEARFKQKAMQVLEGDAFTWSSERFPASVEGKYIVEDRTIFSDGTVQISARSETTGFYTWDETTEEAGRDITGTIEKPDAVFGLDALAPSDYRRTLLANLPQPTIYLDFEASSYDSNLSGALGFNDKADFANDVDGSEKPENNATKSRVFRQTTAPSSPTENDIWYDTDDARGRVYKFDGSTWVEIATLGATWTDDVYSRPTELTDGRVSAGLDASGDVNRAIPEPIRDSSNILGYTGGGLFAGDLSATEGATWTTNVFSRPTELTDGRVAAGLASTGDVDRAIPSSIKTLSDILSRSGGGTFTGDLASTEGADWAGNVTSRPTELTDGRVATGLDASGLLQTNVPSDTQIPSLDAGKITTGSFGDALIAETNVTQHEGAVNALNLTNAPADAGATLGADWTADLTNRPTELTDGRVSAGLASTGDVARAIPSSIKTSSDILSRSGGGTYTGELAATEGADWASNLTSRPTELTDGRVGTGLDASGVLQTAIPSSLADTSDLLRFTGGGVFSGDLAATEGADWTGNVVNRPTELTDGSAKLTRLPIATVIFDFTVKSYDLDEDRTALFDGRIEAGFDSNGDVARPIPEPIRDSSNLLGYTGGGLFSGDLAATEGADWSTNLTSRPTELTDGRVSTGLDASGLLQTNVPSDTQIPALDAGKITTGSFGDARIAQTNVTQHEGAVNALNLTNAPADAGATDGADWSSNLTNRPTELTDGRVSTGLDASGLLQTNVPSDTQIPSLDAGKITTGSFGDARIAQSNVTQHEAAVNALNLTNAPADAGATAGADWATNLTSRPTELTDGRVTAALDSNGDIQNSARVRQLSGSTLRSLGRALATIEAQDGDSVTFATDFSQAPRVRILGGGGTTYQGPSLLDTDTTEVQLQDFQATNVTVSGFDVKAKMRNDVTSSTTSQSDTINTAGGTGEPDLVGTKGTADEAFDDKYTYDGSIDATVGAGETAFITVGIYTSDDSGTTWVQRSTVTVVADDSASTFTFNDTVTVDGLGSTAEFGVSIEDDGAATGVSVNSTTVTYESIGTATEVTATPGSETVFCFVFESDETIE